MQDTNGGCKSQIKKNMFNNRYIIFAAFFVFIAFYILNLFFPLYNDDWNHSMMIDGTPINSFGDLFHNQYIHYLTWGGRSVVHTILQIILYFGEFWAKLFSSLAYISLTIIIYLLANIYNKQNTMPFVFISLLIWFLIPSYTEILWITGSVNYLFGTLIILLFIYPYYSSYLYHKADNTLMKSILFFCGGIVAGWTNENMAVALIFFIIVLLVLMKKKKKQIPTWAFVGLIGALIGCAFMLLAPGNTIRHAAVMANLGDVQASESKLSIYLGRLFYIIKHYYRYLIIYIILFSIYIWKGKTENRKTIIRLSVLFILTSIVAALAMVASPAFPKRAWFGIIIFAIIPIAMMYANINFKKRIMLVANYVILSVGMVFFAIFYISSLLYLIPVHKFVKEREVSIKEQKAKGVEDVIVYEQFPYRTSTWVKIKIIDLPLDEPDDWRCIACANYYGVKSIRVLPKKKSHIILPTNKE